MLLNIINLAVFVVLRSHFHSGWAIVAAACLTLVDPVVYLALRCQRNKK